MVDDRQEDVLAAGSFLPWLDEIGAALRGDRDAEVPCGSCTACCTASQFVHIAPDETDAIAHIPAALLFRAPRLPRGHVLMGYDEQGRCPMLVDDACSIYEHRPRTCRTYDCRVFAAADLRPTEEEKAQIAARVRRWRFAFPGGAGLVEAAAVRTAATFLVEHPESFLDGAGVPSTTQLAVLAVEHHELFVGGQPAPSAVRVALSRRGSR